MNAMQADLGGEAGASSVPIDGVGSALRVDGGMVANDWLCQFLADILDVPVERPVVTETTALGAACLAGLEVGLYPSLEAVAAGWRRAPLRAHNGAERARPAVRRLARAVRRVRAADPACSGGRCRRRRFVAPGARGRSAEARRSYRRSTGNARCKLSCSGSTSAVGAGPNTTVLAAQTRPWCGQRPSCVMNPSMRCAGASCERSPMWIKMPGTRASNAKPSRTNTGASSRKRRVLGRSRAILGQGHDVRSIRAGPHSACI